MGETSQTNGETPNDFKVPKWIDENLFKDFLLKNLQGFSKIQNFKVYPALAPGENYATIMLRVEIIAELDDGQTKTLTYMLKVPHDIPQFNEMMKKNNIFTTESNVYKEIVPELEKMYQDVGIEVNIGAKSYTIDIEEDYVLLEDLKPLGFKNTNRIEGLDMVHTKCVLEKLALWHAGTATRVETKGKYPNINLNGFLDPEQKDAVKPVFDNMFVCFQKCIDKINGHELYKDAVLKIIPIITDVMFDICAVDPNEFNVINHGDCWSNNIMFKYDDCGKIEKTYFVDLQVIRYGSPALDLLYFLMSSTKYELKINQFDYFIKFYHDKLIENLKLLKYPKKLPTLKDLHAMLYRYGLWGFITSAGVMSVVLLDPNDNASLENIFGEDEAGENFKLLMYSNARYCKHMEIIMPWLYNRGALEI